MPHPLLIYKLKLLINLKERFESLGTKIQKITIDNCCQWRNKLKDIFGNHTSVCLDVFHAVQRISRALPKKHQLFHQCVDELWFVFRAGGDIGIKRCKATPLPGEMLSNMDSFVKNGKTQCWASYFVKVTSYILHITCN